MNREQNVGAVKGEPACTPPSQDSDRHGQFISKRSELGLLHFIRILTMSQNQEGLLIWGTAILQIRNLKPKESDAWANVILLIRFLYCEFREQHPQSPSS